MGAMLMFAACASGLPPVAAGERAAYDEAAPDTDPVAHAAMERHRAELMKIPGVSLVYLSNDAVIVVRVRKITPEIDERVPKQLDSVRVKVVSVDDVIRRHLHELVQIAGDENVIGCGTETFPDGQLAIVMRVRRPYWELPIKVPSNIEGIPFRVLIAQDPLTN